MAGMSLDADAAYLALRARDARFDGRLYVGVTTTGIYCRPICRVRTPRRENCRFFRTPAQAEAQAFRPCLKCRPELAPGEALAWSVMDAPRTLAHQAARWLDERATRGGGARITALARALGISDRHLRRIFLAEHGVTPLQYLQTRRLLAAKQLLTDTALPVTEVALASGFGSLRRFNDAFVRHYRMPPSRLRRQAGASAVAGAVRIRLGLRPPCNHVQLGSFLAQRAVAGVESVEVGSTALQLRRSLRWQEGDWTGTGWLQATLRPQEHAVELLLSPELARAAVPLARAVRRWLDLDAVPDVIDTALAGLPCPGTRLPGAIDPFEMAVRAVLGQQVTVAAARALAGRLVQAWGEPVRTPWENVTRLFPAPATLAALDTEALRQLGIVRQRAAALLALAQAWPVIGPVLRTGEPEAALAALQALPGVGPWTAHYIALRALGWPDAFPPGDVAVLRALQRLGLAGTHHEAARCAQAWRPWRAYAVIRLWASLDGPVPLPPDPGATP